MRPNGEKHGCGTGIRASDQGPELPVRSLRHPAGCGEVGYHTDEPARNHVGELPVSDRSKRVETNVNVFRLRLAAVADGSVVFGWDYPGSTLLRVRIVRAAAAGAAPAPGAARAHARARARPTSGRSSTTATPVRFATATWAPAARGATLCSRATAALPGCSGATRSSHCRKRRRCRRLPADPASRRGTPAAGAAPAPGLRRSRGAANARAAAH